MRLRRSRHGALVLVTALLAAAAPGVAAAEPAPPTPADQATGTTDARPRTLTLITGDQVTSIGGRITVRPRKGVQFARFADGKHQYVFPTDAIPLLRADRLDRRLFDVTELLESDYDRLPRLPLIVSDNSTARGLTASRKLPAVDGFAAKVATDDLAQRWETLKTSLTSGKIWLDGMRELSLDVSVPRTGAPTAWSRGLDGTGVKVAVLDSGVDDTHPDLAGKVGARKNFVTDYEGDNDLNGHGTHVASTVAGSGAASGGTHKGVAPGATLLDGKVCFNYYGRGSCPESSILEGMQWAATSGAQVVNLSLGADDTPGVDPLEAAVNDLSAEYGTLFVIAAGNSGAEQTIGSPASAEAALAVGAVNKTGEVDSYSSRGPRLEDYGVKPEITAPGTDIVAARSSFSEGAPEPYVSFTGTSMATPHVAGAAAILTQAHPDWTAEQRKSALVGSARPNPDFGVFDQGAGELDVVRALDQAVSATPATVNVGFMKYPQNDETITRSVTYRNTSDSPVTLRLALDTAAPSGVFSLSADSVTVPAHGESTVELRTAVSAAGSAYGSLSGRIVASADGISVQTPFSVHREQPSADIKVSALDRAGAPAAQSITMIADHASYQAYYIMEPEATLRLPHGTYFVATVIDGEDGTTTVVTDAVHTVDRQEDIVLDGRKARPLDITMPDKTAAPVAVTVESEHPGTYREMIAALAGDSPGSLYTADQSSQPTPKLSTQVTALFAQPNRDGGFTGSPYVYQAGWRVPGSYVTGFTRHVTKKDVAKVSTEYAANVPGALGWRSNTPSTPGISYPTWYDLPPVPLPTTRTEYFVGDVAWESTFTEGTEESGWPVPIAQYTKQAVSYRPGSSSTERWNGAVLGLTMKPSLGLYPVVERRSDELVLRLGGLADAEGHFGNASVDYGGQHLSLYRDGKLVEQRDDALAGIYVDPAPGRYRAELDVTSPTLRLSTRRTTVLEFPSEHTAGSESPSLTAVGFAPKLTIDNTAKKHQTIHVPLTFTQQGPASEVKTLEVDFSYDDGATWQTAPVTRHGAEWSARVKNPGERGYVSLRGHVVNQAGNTVTSTVIRAYEIK